MLAKVSSRLLGGDVMLDHADNTVIALVSLFLLNVHTLTRKQVLCAQNVLFGKDWVNSAVVPPPLLGIETVDGPATPTMTTRGRRASRPVSVPPSCPCLQKRYTTTEL